MNRRNFVKKSSFSGAALVASPYFFTGMANTNKMDRIGLTTVIFRNRFKETCPKNVGITNELTLSSVPEFFVDRFNVHNVEVWAKHFESTEKSYLSDFKKALKKNKCKLIDIQAEGKFDISDTNEENRQKGVDIMKEWIDICAFFQTPFIRIRPMQKSYDKAVESLKVLAEYGKPKGVKILVENHMDLFSNPTNHVNVINDVSNDNLSLLADFGNYPGDVDQMKALKSIAPNTSLISAKSKDFNENMEHLPYDYAQCIEIFDKANYKGIYSCEQWGKPNPDYDYEKITDWMIRELKENIKS